MKDHVLKLLSQRGVFLHQIADIVYYLQKPYCPNITVEGCLTVINEVLEKREVQYAIITGIALDVLAEQGKLPEPLQETMVKDHPLFGVDEVLAYSILNMYGSIATTSFGYLDKQKVGIIGRLNEKDGKSVHTFLDDLVAAIAAAASAKVAHNLPTP